MGIFKGWELLVLCIILLLRELYCKDWVKEWMDLSVADC
jgi:hypothetical protein